MLNEDVCRFFKVEDDDMGLSSEDLELKIFTSQRFKLAVVPPNTGYVEHEAVKLERDDSREGR